MSFDGFCMHALGHSGESQDEKTESKSIMNAPSVRVTYIGGPTCLLEFGGVRLLTDPTFDPGGSEYDSGPVTLRKLAGPAVSPKELGSFDYVLLSHDHHSDNLDQAGRKALANATTVVTTNEGAQRLGANSVGVTDWQSVDFRTSDGRTLRIVATPARHGPEGLSRGAVTGFALFFEDASEHVIYVSGDTVWYEGVAEVARRFNVQVAVLHLGAARVPEVGPFHLTMTALEAVEAARAFKNAVIVPIHFEDWAHFSEGRAEVKKAFANAEMERRLLWPERGRPTSINPQSEVEMPDLSSALGQSLAQILKRPEITIEHLVPILRELAPDVFAEDQQLASNDGFFRNELKSVETEIKYEGYLQQQQRAIERMKKAEQRTIPEWFDYKSVSGLSREMQETLIRIRPRTLGHASRIPGVTPAAVSLVNVYIEIQAKRRQKALAV